MFKKRLKGLLAMLLAGSIATTALPLTASATFVDDAITIKGGDLDDRTIAPSEIGESSFTAGVLHNNTTYLTEKNLWAVYTYWNEGRYGDIGVAVPGDKLAKKLNEYETDDSRNFYASLIKYTHDLAFTTKDIENTPEIKNADLISKKADVFPYDISSVISEIDVDPLMEITSWTAWYNRDPDNNLDDYNYADNCIEIDVTPNPISEKISTDIVEKVYIANDFSAYNAINCGKTIIQLNTEYKTFEIPVYDGLCQETTDVISVTQGQTDDLVPEGKTEALSGNYILVYKKDSANTKTIDNINDKGELWNAIVSVKNDYSEFAESKAVLLRDVRYSVSEAAYNDSNSKGLFNSLDLYNNESYESIQYFNSHSAAGDNIWRVVAEIAGNNHVEFTDDVKTTIAAVLNTTDTDSIILSNMANIAVTPNKPDGVDSTIDYEIGGGIIYDYPVNIYPAAIDNNIARYLTEKKNPTAGYKYDTDNWTLWGITPCSGGVDIRCNVPVADESNGIGIAQYKNMPYQYSSELLVYLPQTEITVSVTDVDDPVSGNTPDTIVTIPANDGYEVTDVSWYEGTTKLADGEAFVGGKQYTVYVTLDAYEGLSFVSTTPATINGTPAQTTLNPNGTLTAYYTFEALPLLDIYSAALKVAEPELGKAPVNEATIVTENAKFTVSDVKWNPNDAAFKAETEYTVSVKLTADPGYKFADDISIKINDKTATVTKDDDGTLNVSYTFGKLSDGPSAPTPRPDKPGYERKPAKTEKSEGWSSIIKEMKAADISSTIKISLNDDTYISDEALQVAIDRKLKLIMDANFGRVWTIDGAKAVPGDIIDLTTAALDVGIPADAYKNIAYTDGQQLKLNARALNFTAKLTATIGGNNIGKNAAVYLYNEATGKLMFRSITVVDTNGNVTFDVEEGGRYFIAMGSEVKAPDAIRGDVNGDGVVNALDASAILKNVANNKTTDKQVGDTNSDGKVNALDAATILKYVVGDIKEFPDSAA